MDRPSVKSELIHKRDVSTVCFSPSQNMICSSGKERKVILSNPMNSKTIAILEGHRNAVVASSFSTDGNVLATCSSRNIIRTWDVSVHMMKNLRTLKITSEELRVEFSFYLRDLLFFRGDSSRVVCCGNHYKKPIAIMDIEQKKLISSFKIENIRNYAQCVDIQPDNRTIVSGVENSFRRGFVCFWDVRSKKCLKSLDHHRYTVSSIQIHPNSFLVASGSTDETIKIVDTRTYKVLHTFDQHILTIESLTFHPFGKYLISGSGDETVKVFDIVRNKEAWSLGEHNGTVNSVQFSPRDQYFASGGADKKVFVWRFPFKRQSLDIDLEERARYLIEIDLPEQRNVLKIRMSFVSEIHFYKILCMV